MLETLLTGLAAATAVSGFLFLALLTGFYIRYRVSGAGLTSKATLATAVVESILLASALFAGLLGAAIGHDLGGPAGAGVGLLVGFPIGALAAIGYSASLSKRIVRMLAGH